MGSQDDFSIRPIRAENTVPEAHDTLKDPQECFNCFLNAEKIERDRKKIDLNEPSLYLYTNTGIKIEFLVFGGRNDLSGLKCLRPMKVILCLLHLASAFSIHSLRAQASEMPRK